MCKLYSLCFFLVFAIVLSVHGQTMVSFAYDAAGNRVKREIVLSRSMPSAAPEDNYENTFFDTFGKRTVKLTGISPDNLKIEILGYEPSDDAFAEVYTLSGIKLLSQSVRDAVAEIDVSRHPAGTYILIISVNGRQTTWKIAKQ